MTQQSPVNSVRRIAPSMLAAWLDAVPAKRPLAIVDVREGYELSRGVIPKSIHLPAHEVSKRVGDQVTDKTTTVVV